MTSSSIASTRNSRNCRERQSGNPPGAFRSARPLAGRSIRRGRPGPPRRDGFRRPGCLCIYQDYVNLFASLHWARVDQAVLRNAAGPRSPEEQKVSCGKEGEAPGWASGSCQSAGVSPDPVSAVVHRLPSSLGGSSAHAVVPRQRPPLLSGSRADLRVRQPRRLEMECRRPGSGIRPARRCSLTGDGNDGGSNSCRPSDANGRLPTGQRERGAGWRGGRLGPEVFVGLRRAGNRLCQRTDGHAPRPCHVRGGLADRRLPPRRRVGLPRRKEAKTCGSTDILHPYPSQGSPRRAPQHPNPGH